MSTFSIEATPLFQKETKALEKKYPSFKNDLQILIDSLKQDPKQGTALGKDCYKIRISSKAKGKAAAQESLLVLK
ncbi:MAG: hypothetical protein K2Q24_09880 [Chitinophagaceae bacterium]|jgi:mRNA-degrading endonuclease RelE of RelBE toxin-antitoxin system|nr:hypothetical protein [Chitinophagaceae bacterium]